MYKHILYIHIYTSTFIIYIYSNLLLLEQKITSTKSLKQGKEAWSWRITRKLVNTRWRPWSTNLAEANSRAVKSQGHKLSFFFPSRSRFKAFPSPVTSTNTKNLSFQSHADLRADFKIRQSRHCWYPTTGFHLPQGAWELTLSLPPFLSLPFRIPYTLSPWNLFICRFLAMWGFPPSHKKFRKNWRRRSIEKNGPRLV